MPEAPDGGTRRALLIGIDAYVNRPLDGCVADARLMEQLLRERFAFQPQDITMLLDGAASREAVLAQLDELVDLTQPGDAAFIFYAGHGSQIADDDDEEASTFDSTLLVSDSPRSDILDDEFHERLVALGDRTAFTVLVFDSCHSGTISRGTFGTKGRWYPSAKRSQRPKAPPPAGASRGAASRSVDRYLLLAAARDTEIAQESTIAGEGSEHHGAFTFALVQELQRARLNETWRDVFERAARRVTADHREQHPQIEGAADRALFGLQEFVAMPHVQVLTRAASSVELAAGMLHGCTVGSTYAVYEQGTKDTDAAEPLGSVAVLLVKGATSRARIVSEREPGAIVAGARAVETRHALGDTTLAVQLEVIGLEANALDTLRTQLESLPVVALVTAPDAASVRVYRVGLRDRVGDADPMPWLGALTSPRWAIVGRDGRPAARIDADATEGDVVKALVRRANHDRALSLDNRDPASRMRGKVSLDILRKDDDGSWAVAQDDAEAGLPIFTSGEPIGFRMSSTLEESVFVTLLDFDPFGKVSQLTKGSANQLAPTSRFELGTDVRRIRLRWDDDDAVESFKLIATVRPVDFTALTQVDEPRRATEESLPLTTDDWTTQRRQVVVRRRPPDSA